MGAGVVVRQRAILAKEAIQSKELFKTPKWVDLSNLIKQNNKTLHYIGLLSDGYVHSHITHLFGLLEGAMETGIKSVCVHTLLDGRDVPPQSSIIYIEKLEKELNKINESGDFHYRIGSGGGRMRVTMDRYNSDWEVVRRGWEAHVFGIAEEFPNYEGYFNSATTAITQARKLDPDISDQYLPSFVVVDENKVPVGKMEDGDAVIYFNFRGDRAIQISRAFDEENFKEFERMSYPKVNYFGLLQYDEELQIPKNFLINPPVIKDTIVDYLSAENIPMFAIAETHKFGHVTYFYTGNQDLKVKSEIIEKADQKMILSQSSKNETYLEVVSDPSETVKDRPKMKAYEVKQELLKAVISNKYKFIRVNFANGDMVGHTGSKSAAMIAAETVDECVKEIVETIESLNGIAIVTADHGNLDDMKDYETAHTLNPVMFAIVDSGYNNEYTINESIEGPSLGNITATILNLLGYEKPDGFLDSLIKFI